MHVSRKALSSDCGLFSGTLIVPEEDAGRPLLVCIHGSGCSSRYFEIGDMPVASAAAAENWPILLVNRPGYAGNRMLPGRSPITDSVPALRSFIDRVDRDHIRGEHGLALIGHSIGGAVALMLASGCGEWPLRAVAVSGIGDAPAQRIKDWCSAPDFGAAKIATEEALFFGPTGAFTWRRAVELRRVREPGHDVETAEIVFDWPKHFLELAPDIEVPVQIRLAEHEQIWETGEEPLARMTSAFRRAPEVDAAILPDGGHLYELHKRGPDLVSGQLAFLARFS